MPPGRSYEVERQDEFLVNKQLKPGSSKLVRRNLPTLIEASPDFNKKQLPYLPNLPPSVQVPALSATSPNLQNWFDQKRWEVLEPEESQYLRSRRDRTLQLSQDSFFRPNSRSESVSSIGFGSVYGGSTLSKRSRSSSITFLQDVSPKRSKEKKRKESSEKDKGRKSRKEKENRAKKQQLEETQAAIFAEEKEEILHRPSSGKDTKRAGRERDRDKSHSDRDKSHSDKETGRRSAAKDKPKRSPDLARKSYSCSGLNEDSRECSMWSCCRCTLENPLVQPACSACGGSRLCSIGEINVEALGHPPPESGDAQLETPEKDGRWTCLVCTLQNAEFSHYCDACNSPSPNNINKEETKMVSDDLLLAPVKNVPHEVGLKERLPRLAAILILAAFFIYFIVSVAIVAGAAVTRYTRHLVDIAVATGNSAVSAVEWPTHHMADQLNSVAGFAQEVVGNGDGTQDEDDSFGYELFGLNLRLLGIFTPVFLYFVTTRLRLN